MPGKIILIGRLNRQGYLQTEAGETRLTTIPLQAVQAPESAILKVDSESLGKVALVRGQRDGGILYPAEIMEVWPNIAGALLLGLLEKGTLSISDIQDHLEKLEPLAKKRGTGNFWGPESNHGQQGGASMPTFFPFWQGIQNLQRTRFSIKKSAMVFRRPVAITFSSLLLVSLLPQWGNCAELRPYELPSQKQAPYQQRFDAPAQKPASTSFDYKGFGTKAANLPLEERAKLKQGLQDRFNRALEENYYEEVGHYAKLLEIINNIR